MVVCGNNLFQPCIFSVPVVSIELYHLFSSDTLFNKLTQFFMCQMHHMSV